MKKYANNQEEGSNHCCKDLKYENQRMREVLLYLAEERFCTPHMRVRIFEALNPPINRGET